MNSGTRRRVALRRVLHVVLAPPLLAPSAVQAQIVVGRVVDDLSGAPLPVTTVMFIDTLNTVLAAVESDAAGRFIFSAPSPGIFRVYADRLGYEEIISESFSLRGIGPIELELRMVPRPFELDSLVVTAEGREAKLDKHGFYRRRSASTGYFFDAEDVRREHPVRLTDLLKQVPGVRVMATASGATRLLSRRMRNALLRGGGGCQMKVVVDGFKLDLTPDESIDDWVVPTAVVGIEIYPGAGGSGAPIEYRGPDAFCGLILLWTR